MEVKGNIPTELGPRVEFLWSYGVDASKKLNLSELTYGVRSTNQCDAVAAVFQLRGSDLDLAT